MAAFIYVLFKLILFVIHCLCLIYTTVCLIGVSNLIVLAIMVRYQSRSVLGEVRNRSNLSIE